MRVTPTTAKAVLVAFLLSAQLCPCPAPAADFDESPAGGTHHELHSAASAEASEDCHGETSRDDCAMPDTDNLDGIAAKVDSFGDGYESAVGIHTFVGNPAATRQLSGSTSPPPDPPPSSTPVALRDRMLD